jgi:hypothetical protein
VTLAAYQKEHAAYGFVVRGPYILSEEQRAAREAEVRAVVAEIEGLAVAAESRSIAHAEIDPLLARFREVGKHAPGELVSEVARAIATAEAER